MKKTIFCFTLMLCFTVNIFKNKTFANDKPVSTPVQTQAPSAKEAVKYEKKSITISKGKISADIITVDLTNPNVKFEVVTPSQKLNSTMPFSSIVNFHKPIAAINGNFFNAYNKIKDPVGSIMSNGEFLYVSSGLTSMGITKDKKIIFGEPMIFTKIRTVDDGALKEYVAYEVNVLSQAGEQTVLYTKARGESIQITSSGMIMEVKENVITRYFKASVNDVVDIPSNGYILFFSDAVTNYDYFTIPEIGRKVSIFYEPFKVDEENFDLANSFSVVSGSPRLVKGGAIDNTPLVSGFAGDSRFSTSSAPRTAVGKTKDGKLVLVSTSCTITQLKQVMLNIGCTDAVNLDGGGSNAMYVNGSYIRTPGRELTSVILIK